MSKNVYIVLSRTGTAFSKATEKITGEKYNHASIGFDSRLEEIYSFNMASDVGGFHKESIDDFEGAHLLVYFLRIDKKKMEELRAQLDHYARSNVEYNFEGLVNAFLRTNVFDESPNQICSQFVTNLLRDVDIDLFEGRPASTIRPQDYVNNDKLRYLGSAYVRNGSMDWDRTKAPSSFL